MSALVRTVAPATGVISLSEAKAQARVDHSDDDALIAALVDTASGYIEDRCGRAFVTQTWQWAIESATGAVDLPKLPVQSVSSITYYDANNTLQSADVNDFYIYADDDSAIIEPKSGASWPSAYPRGDAIMIEFIAGYGDAFSVPVPVKQAALMLVAHWYDNRGVTTAGPQTPVMLAVDSLLERYHVGWAAA